MNSGWSDDWEDAPRIQVSRTPDILIDEMLRAVDLVQLVGEQVALKKTGRDQWMGLCPFHTEKTPSFKVDGEKNLYYCFGCHEGGNAFTFLRKACGLSGKDAFNRLKEMSGMGDIKGIDWTFYKAEAQRRGVDEIISGYESGERDAKTLEELTRIVSMVGGNMMKHDETMFAGIAAFYQDFLRAVWDDDEEGAAQIYETFQERLRGLNGSDGDATGDAGTDDGVPGVPPA